MGVLTNANGLGGGSTWIQLAPQGTPPSTRVQSSAVYNSEHNILIVFGGTETGFARMNDVWLLSNANGTGGTPVWSKAVVAGVPPAGRTDHRAVYDAATNQMFVFGGVSAAPFSDLWVLSHADGTGGTPEWTQLVPSNSGPMPRFGHSLVVDPSTGGMIVFGGDIGSSLADVWLLGVKPPLTSASASPTPDADGWNNGPVSVSLSAVDNSGAGLKETRYKLTGAQSSEWSVYAGPVSISIEGQTTISYYSLDNAGTQEQPKSMTVALDLTNPGAIFGAATPQANSSGWNTTNVTIPFTTFDALSGVASSSPSSPLVITGEGSSLSAQVRVMDKAGNVVVLSTAPVKIDRTAPVIQGAPSNATRLLWPPNHQLVQVATLAASDALSGFRALDITVTSNETLLPGDVVVSGSESEPRTISLRAERNGTNKEGRIYTVTATARDQAGNTASKAFQCSVAHDQGN